MVQTATSVAICGFAVSCSWFFYPHREHQSEDRTADLQAEKHEENQSLQHAQVLDDELPPAEDSVENHSFYLLCPLAAYLLSGALLLAYFILRLCGQKARVPPVQAKEPSPSELHQMRRTLQNNIADAHHKGTLASCLAQAQ
eukprot:CAMPEP_0194521042 /NCGR_PEP_ID=MMETSP0253-20130528/55240_1 /TAXON_ID=2966 /ORGANISM="Noctiluca scintillans" /LENGTH=141 /DNA_ID=CAMNT_0039365359 /DNA_START=1 /DNA_END=423 /DNA_ORIENTATION=+